MPLELIQRKPQNLRKSEERNVSVLSSLGPDAVAYLESLVDASKAKEREGSAAERIGQTSSNDQVVLESESMVSSRDPLQPTESGSDVRVPSIRRGSLDMAHRDSPPRDAEGLSHQGSTKSRRRRGSIHLPDVGSLSSGKGGVASPFNKGSPRQLEPLSHQSSADGISGSILSGGVGSFGSVRGSDVNRSFIH